MEPKSGGGAPPSLGAANSRIAGKPAVMRPPKDQCLRPGGSHAGQEPARRQLRLGWARLRRIWAPSGRTNAWLNNCRMHFQCMAYTTLTIRDEVAKRLRAAKVKGESCSDTLNRLLDEQPALTVGEWLESLVPLEGRKIFSGKESDRLKKDQRNPRDSRARRKGQA
jgi:Putative antitoxin